MKFIDPKLKAQSNVFSQSDPVISAPQIASPEESRPPRVSSPSLNNLPTQVRTATAKAQNLIP
ncbi:hypothetical protein L484_015027 [Morus notabilis]|uniref:Uncharacterized protein n=1 Tax=Morus notabilis TaxID=981085 RepID=W9REU9_9ROSA|nr:hypothetical protein L484_015027 [Morus notabilis]